MTHTAVSGLGIVESIIYPPGNKHIPPWEKGKSSTQNAIFGGYVSSLEGIAICPDDTQTGQGTAWREWKERSVATTYKALI